MAGIELDGVNQKVVLDSDGDTYLEAATDDTIKVYVAGAHDATISANAINVLSGTTLTIDSGATITNSGTANGFGSNEPSSADGQALGSASAEWSDLFLADGGIIKFGNDQDTLLTHTDGTGLTLNSTNKLCFNDATQFIQGASGTVLNIAATDEIDLTATAVDLNGTLDVSGTSLLTGRVGVVTAGDLGTGIHVRTADSGAGVSTNADELVVENSGTCGISILSGNSQNGVIHFGDDGDNDIGNIDYDHSDNSMKFVTNAVEKVRILDDGDVHFKLDDKGLVFGAGQDVYFGSNNGEQGMTLVRGDAFAEANANAGGGMNFNVQATAEPTDIFIIGGEGKCARIKLGQDQVDDNEDLWEIGQGGTNGAANGELLYTDFGGGSLDNEGRLSREGVWTTEGAQNASTTIDYAEYFEWKTELANDAKIVDTYGLSVVLDNGKVRLAETGEEAKVLGIVRPNDVSALVGGGQEFKYKDRWEKNVWGQITKEEYTQCDWDETRTKYWKDGDTLPDSVSVGDVRGTYVHHHKYHKDRIPAKVLKPDYALDKSEPTWHTLASNLTSEDLVVPSTDAEKSAANYVERTTYKKDKGIRKKDDKLMRKKVNSSYNSTKTYKPRSERRKEWCIVGLLGQVEVRDTAIVPTHWTKLKNLETGIDMYYVFNK